MPQHRNRKRYTIRECRTAARANGGKCLSVVFVGPKVGMRWQCASSHTWVDSLYNVMRGVWCLDCVLVSRSTNQ